MISINGTDISFTRGDSVYIKVTPKKDGEPYIPQEGDVIRFAMKKRYKDPDESVLINKELTIIGDDLILKIAPEETKALKMNAAYVYDIELTDVDGDVCTFIKGNIILTEEVL